MKFELKKVVNSREIYDYMRNLPFPYNYEVEYNTWEKSYLYDIDGEGRTLFSDLTTVGAYLDSKLVGFIQYGRTAFGFDENGERVQKDIVTNENVKLVIGLASYKCGEEDLYAGKGSCCPLGRRRISVYLS